MVLGFSEKNGAQMRAEKSTDVRRMKTANMSMCVCMSVSLVQKQHPFSPKKTALQGISEDSLHSQTSYNLCDYLMHSIRTPPGFTSPILSLYTSLASSVRPALC
jgi:hypothetical protein